MAHNFVERVRDLAVANAATVSSAFQIAKWAVFVGLAFPAMDDGVIGLSVCATSGGTYLPVLDPADGEDLVLCASGSDPGFIDMSDFVRCIPSTWYIKLTCAAQSSGAVTLQILERG
jgi:hypothetical protein